MPGNHGEPDRDLRATMGDAMHLKACRMPVQEREQVVGIEQFIPGLDRWLCDIQAVADVEPEYSFIVIPGCLSHFHLALFAVLAPDGEDGRWPVGYGTHIAADSTPAGHAVPIGRGLTGFFDGSSAGAVLGTDGERRNKTACMGRAVEETQVV